MAEDKRRELGPNETIRGEFVFAKLGGISMAIGRAQDIIAGFGDAPETLVVNLRTQSEGPAPTNLDSYAVKRVIGWQDGVAMARDELTYRQDHPTEGDRHIERVEGLERAIDHTETLREREAAARDRSTGEW